MGLLDLVEFPDQVIDGLITVLGLRDSDDEEGRDRQTDMVRCDPRLNARDHAAFAKPGYPLRRLRFGNAGRARQVSDGRHDGIGHQAQQLPIDRVKRSHDGTLPKALRARSRKRGASITTRGISVGPRDRRGGSQMDLPSRPCRSQARCNGR